MSLFSFAEGAAMFDSTPIENLFLMEYLSNTEAETVFRVHAYAYALSLLVPSQMNNSLEFSNWSNAFDDANSQAHFTNTEYTFPRTMFGSWSPRNNNSHLKVYAGILAEQVNNKEHPAVCAVIDDDKNHWTDKYEEEWNGLLRFSNMMQFGDCFMTVSKTGLDQMVYLSLPVMNLKTDTENIIPSTDSSSGWSEIKEMLFDEEAKAFADAAADQQG